MQKFEPSPPSKAAARVEEYMKEPVPATSSLGGILAEEIGREGPMDFSVFMERALYHPDLGYYAREGRRVGREGDFFTSVSVGALFGELLARRFLREWRELGAPERWRILELGADDGSLALDVLDALQRLDGAAFHAVEYAICEPLERLRDKQRGRLEQFGKRVMITPELDIFYRDPLPGVVFGNELLDALPFEVVEWRGGGWKACKVGFTEQAGFFWHVENGVMGAELERSVAALGEAFPEGYRTEVRVGLRDFLQPLTRCLSGGVLLWLDYGFARPEYYTPERHSGTMRTFSRHRAGEDPLGNPGENDITAHVDFTAVAEAAWSLGCSIRVFCDQGAWLTEIGRDWLLAQEGQPDLGALRQFQTLTHPAHLGGCFHVLELGWNRAKGQSVAERESHRLALFACGDGNSQSHCAGEPGWRNW